MLTRETILKALQAAVEPLDTVDAMWQGGAAAFNRVDDWSDIDLQILAADDRIAEVVAVVEKALTSLSPIDLRYELPQPSWHGHWQTFYRLKEAGEFLLIDLVILKRSSTQRFLEAEIHGKAVVHFDKTGVIVSPPFDAGKLIETLRGRLDTLRVTFDLFQSLTLKELKRGNSLEALAFYQGFTLRPLVEVLRMRFDPTRYNFHTRYVKHYFPADVAQRLEPFFFVTGIEDLRAKFTEAQVWFWEAVEQVDLKEIERKL